MHSAVYGFFFWRITLWRWTSCQQTAGVLFAEKKTTSRRSCASYTGWRRRSESTTSWLSLSTNASMDRANRNSLMNSADWLISKGVAVFTPRRHHGQLCAQVGCQPLPTGLFQLLPVVCWTLRYTTSRLHNLCLSSAVASRVISVTAAFLTSLKFLQIITLWYGLKTWVPTVASPEW